jgi:hypothetical protein
MIEYRGWKIFIEEKDDGAWFTVVCCQFTATCGNYVGPEVAEQSAKVLIEILEEVDYLG